MRRPIASVALLLLLAGGAFLLIQYDPSGWAQRAASSYGSARAGSMMSGMGGEMDMGASMDAGMSEMMGGDEMGGGMYGERLSPFEQFKRQLHQQGAALRQAKSAGDKERAKSAIQKLLGDYFDSDMKRRQQELAKVKQRVAKLEALLKKRQTAKQEIIDLQLRTTVNESEGLGFFSAPGSGQQNAYGGYEEMYGEGGADYEMESGGYGGGMMGGVGEGGYGMEMDMYGGGEESTGRARKSR